MPIEEPRAAETGFSFASLAATLSHRVVVEHPPHTVTVTEPARRDAHPKHHGCVDATFTVRDDLPVELRRGVFQPGASYPALIRFSNAFKVRHDLQLDARGMAIKLLCVTGERVKLPILDGKTPDMLPEEALTQDFLLVTHSEFFSRTAAEFVKIVSSIIKTGASPTLALTFISLRPPRIAWRNILALIMTMRWTSNPLYLKYFSQTPYQMGDIEGAPGRPQAAKFGVRPLQSPSLAGRLAFTLRVAWYLFASKFSDMKKSENRLRESLRRYLATREATFEFCVQLRTDPDQMPLDDATRRWSKKASPYVAVATIRIHQARGYADPEGGGDAKFVEDRLRLGERVSYTPWHALEAHRPLGSINAARAFVYATVSRTRSGLNGTNAHVPPTPCPGIPHP